MTGRDFEIRHDVMEAQSAYVARGLRGESPDMDLWLIPEAVRPWMKAGYGPPGMWLPTKAEAMTMDSDEMWRRQRTEGAP